MPDFGDGETLLKACGTIVVTEIVAMIEREQRPDGLPQKQNQPAYREAKRALQGYTTPLKGISKISPYLARPETFLRTMINEFTEGGGMNRALLIHLNQKRAEIGKKLTLKGYWFMGITRRAEELVAQRASRYFAYKVAQMRGRGA